MLKEQVVQMLQERLQLSQEAEQKINTEGLDFTSVINKPWTSVSEITQYLACPRKWALSKHYPGKPSKALIQGSAFHQLLEEFYKMGQDNEEDMRCSLDEFLQTKQLPADVLPEQFIDETIKYVQAYIDYAKAYDDFEILFEEYLLITTIGNTQFKCLFDGLVWKDEQLWIMEHKTAKVVTQDHLFNDLQVVMYAAVLEGVTGLTVGGVIYNQVSKTKVPKVTRTYITFSEAEKKNAINYIATLGPIIVGERADVLNDRNRVASTVYRPSRDCSWGCDYTDLCMNINHDLPLADPIKIEAEEVEDIGD